MAQRPASGRGLETDSLGSIVLWSDYDCYGAQEEGITQLEDLPVPPTLIVNSGYGLQAFWRLDAFCTDPLAIKKRNKALKLRLNLNGDLADSVFDLARVMRVPGTLNRKQDVPVPAHIAAYHPERVYPLSAFEEAELEEDPIEVWEGEELPANFWQQVKDKDKKLAARIASEDYALKIGAQTRVSDASRVDRSRNDQFIANRLLALGFTPGQILSVLTHDKWFSGSKFRETKRYDYAVTIVNKALKRVKQSDQASQKKPTSEDFIRVLEELGYTFRLNELSDSIEVNGQPITDAIAAEIRTAMRDKGFESMRAMEDAYTAHALRNKYHPIKEYLNGLKWNGQAHIAELASYFEDEHESITLPDGSQRSVFHTWLRTWLIGAVAKVFDREQNYTLVLDGPQDIGKSTFAAWLAGGIGSKYFIEEAINPDNKDHSKYLLDYWIWEIGELGATTRKRDVEALKAFLTKREVTVRVAYGRYDLHKPAIASHIGTINNDCGFLVDQTGNRRFLVVTLKGINWEYIKLDVNQVWAEAVTLYKQGEPWKLSVEEKTYQRNLNEEYEVTNPLEDMLKKYFILTQGEEFMSTTDIREYLEALGVLRGDIRANEMRIAQAAKRLGLKKHQQGRGGPRGWLGIKVYRSQIPILAEVVGRTN